MAHTSCIIEFKRNQASNNLILTFDTVQYKQPNSYTGVTIEDMGVKQNKIMLICDFNNNSLRNFIYDSITKKNKRKMHGRRLTGLSENYLSSSLCHFHIIEYSTRAFFYSMNLSF